MTQVMPEPFVLKNATLKIGATDTYEGSVSEVTFTPTVQTLTWQGMTPAASYSDTSSPSWVATLGYPQDWKTPNSLSRYLYDHQGETVPVEFTTNPGAGVWTADLIITPGAVGGPVNAYAVATVQLGVSGQPQFTPPAPLAAAADTADIPDDTADTAREPESAERYDDAIEV